MKIGILSDSHDNLPAISKAVSLFNDADVSLVVHAGDLVSPFVSLPLKELRVEFTAVFGNNDGERIGLYNVFKGRIHRPPHELDFGGKKILILHEPDNLELLAGTGHYDAIIYGHTHIAHVRKDRTWVINPGETAGWLKGKRTVAVWDLSADDVQVLPI
jgi:uncharacterized protein